MALFTPAAVAIEANEGLAVEAGFLARHAKALAVLRSLAENLDPRLIEAWPRDTRAARRAFAQLQRAYVEARYSPAYEITPDELAWIIYRVKHLHAIAAAICAEHLAGNGKGTA